MAFLKDGPRPRPAVRENWLDSFSVGALKGLQESNEEHAKRTRELEEGSRKYDLAHPEELAAKNPPPQKPL